MMDLLPTGDGLALLIGTAGLVYLVSTRLLPERLQAGRPTARSPAGWQAIPG